MSVLGAYKELQATPGVDVVRDELLARRTSYRIGGPATLSATANTYAALVRTIAILDEQQVGWVVLGRGSNVLVSDNGFDGCVVRLGTEFSHLSLGEEGQLTVGAGAVLSRVVAKCQSEGLSGLEMCVGVPGSMGGAVSMNAGTRDEWIGKRIASVVTFRPGRGLVRYEPSEIDWGYRWNSIPGSELICEVTLALEEADPAKIAADMERRMSRRKRRQPLGMPCCGSVFRNPVDHSAGQLVESCGLKGFAVGGAQVSEVHANFVVNKGRATASDVLTVIHRMHDEVYARYGIDMHPEVKFLGFS